MNRKCRVTGFGEVIAFCCEIYPVHIFVIAHYASSSILFNDAVSCWVYMALMPIQVAARSKALVCGRSLAGIAGSNSAGFITFCLLWVFCVVRLMSLYRSNHSSRGVLPTVVCLNVIVKPWQWGDPGTLGAVVPGRNVISVVDERTKERRNKLMNQPANEWMNEYGALVEGYWQGKYEILGGMTVAMPLCPHVPQIPRE